LYKKRRTEKIEKKLNPQKKRWLKEPNKRSSLSPRLNPRKRSPSHTHINNPKDTPRPHSTDRCMFLASHPLSVRTRAVAPASSSSFPRVLVEIQREASAAAAAAGVSGAWNGERGRWRNPASTLLTALGHSAIAPATCRPPRRTLQETQVARARASAWVNGEARDARPGRWRRHYGAGITALARYGPRWRDSLQCAMALAMPSCFSTSESSRRAAAAAEAEAERLFRSRRSVAAPRRRCSRLEILLRYRRMTSPEGGLAFPSSRGSWSGEPYPYPYAAKSLAERALPVLREKLARPP
jgi:hypothetical protein